VAVEAWCAWHGEGKTYCAVAHCLTQFDAHGTEVWSNASIEGCRRFESWDELMALIEEAIVQHLRVIVLIDEAGKWLPARFWNKMDPRVLTVLQERRKVGAGLDLFWTAPAFRHVDSNLRDVTQVVHVPKRWGGTEYSHDGGRPPRGFVVRDYKPEEIESKGKKPIQRKIIPFELELAQLYRTGIVNMAKPLDAVHGTRPDYQSEADRAAREAPRPAVRLEVVAPRGRR